MSKPTPRKFNYPPANQDDIVDDYHGHPVADPYRWLEDPDSPETQAWVAAQNELTQSFMAELPVWPQFKERLTELWDYAKYTVPLKRGSHYFFQKNDGLQNQAVLYRQESLASEPKLLLDPNTFSEDGTVALVNQSYSRDGRLLAYALSQSGSDWNEIHVRETGGNRTYDDVIQWCKFTSISWKHDGSGFFYARYPAPDEMPDAPPSTHQKVYFHQLGTPQSEDELIYARPDAPDLGFNPFVTDDGRYLVLHVWEGTDRRNRFYYYDLDTEQDVVRLVDTMEAKYYFIGNDGPRFYFETDLDADNGRIIAIDIRQPAREHWREIIPEGDNAIAFSQIVNDQFVVAYLHHAHHRLTIYEKDGAPAGEIPLPTMGNIFAMAGKPEHTELFFDFQSFLYPPTIFRYDFETAVLTPLHKPQIDFDPDRYETNQVFYTSKDGTRVPMFLTHKKGMPLDGNNPTLLYGYGGFNISLPPSFAPARLGWLERGGVFAQANLRGGNEYGEAWHQAGMLEKKQNVFNDFIAAAEWLIENKVTTPRKLAIDGRSNGGLLVAACMVQRPDLYGAVHCGVPVIDMLRYHKFSAGRYWTAEYGNAAENADHFNFMMAYSPLHNVKEGITYPPLLITTADTDDRVVPMHAKKFAAALQTADAGANPLLLRVEMRAGHGMGKPTGKQIEEASDIYAFLWTMLNGRD